MICKDLIGELSNLEFGACGEDQEPTPTTDIEDPLLYVLFSLKKGSCFVAQGSL